MTLQISNSLTDDDFELFKTLFQDNIASLYPNSTIKTADSIIQNHILGVDPNGYFTKRKTIWKGSGEHNKTVAFTVISEKRGGSIKFGPTIVSQAYRGQGIGSAFRKLVEDEYAKLGYRKAYSTTNLSNLSGILYVLKIGYKIELHLRNHYSIKADELVLSKSIDTGKHVETIQNGDFPNIPEFITNYLEKYYDEIDARFFENIDKALTEKFDFSEEFFIGKKKHRFQIDSEEQYAIVSPKRGGCAKISPLIFNSKSQKNTEFIQSILNEYDGTSIHKFYTFIPIDRFDEISLLKNNGFYVEGIITEPYKRGVDLLMLSLLKTTV